MSCEIINMTACRNLPYTALFLLGLSLAVATAVVVYDVWKSYKRYERYYKKEKKG